MLSVEAARKIGINACIDRLGRAFVMTHKESATSAYGENEDGVFCFVGVDDSGRSQNSDHVLVLDSHSEFPYRASCNIDLRDGSAHFLECVIPKQ